MFDLDHEVATWSAAVHAERCQASDSVAELRDHLYCEIDRARAEGFGDEEAFRLAVARLGSTADLSSEAAKNRSALGTACQLAAKVDRASVSPEHRGLLMAHAVVWSTLMIASTVMLKGGSLPQVAGWLLIVVFMPLWWASDQLLRSALRQGQTR